jgi:nucleoside-diphosphate-sugar epimerase
MSEHKKFFCFGLGFSGQTVLQQLNSSEWDTGGTVRDQDVAMHLSDKGTQTVLFDGTSPLADIQSILHDVTHLLISVPPSVTAGDPVLNHHQNNITEMKSLEWVGYLSTTGVYGDTGGQLVDETAPLSPTSERSRARLVAERGWLALYHNYQLPVHVFRLSGIYGQGRSVLDTVRAGKARQIVKPDHKFSRIHVADIANVVGKSMQSPNPGAIYNMCDDEAAPPADVTAYACQLLGIEPPPLVSFDEAKETMSPMALSFWNDNRLVDNSRIKRELVKDMLYPTYREGLDATFRAEQQQN